MTLRLALVIDGDAAGAKRALQETSGAVEDLGRKAEAANKKLAPGSTIDWGPKAADSLKKIKDDAPAAAEALADVAEAGRDAAPEIDSVGSAAAGAAPKFSNLKDMVFGAAAGFAAGFGAAAVAAGLSAAAGAAADLAREIFSNTPQIERDLKSHEQLVRAIKGAYAETQGAASSYGLNSTALLRFQAQQNVARLERDTQAAVGDLEGVGAFNPVVAAQGGGADNLGPLRQAVNDFRKDLAAGKADVIAFRDEVGKIAESLPADSKQRTMAETIIGDTEQAANLQAELKRAQDLLQGLKGDAEAAATALGGSAEKYQGLGHASGAAATPLDNAAGGIKAGGDEAAAANPHLAETERLLRAIAALPSPARAAVTPATSAPKAYASGGIVDRPTLFSYGAGETGLMGEAGEEAILPLSGGMVKARASGGREIGLSLTRLSGGDLGVELPTAFAAGGVVGKVRAFATGGTVKGSSSAGGLGGLDLEDLEQALQDLRGAATGLAKALISGTDPMEALGQAALSLADKLADAALNTIGNYLFGSSGSGSGILGSLLSSLLGGSTTWTTVSAGLWHGGGTIGTAPAASRTVPLSLFAGAPRLHDGGILQAGEKPAILMEGEEVGWPDQLSRKYGGGQTVNNFYVETPTPRSFAESRATVARGASRFVNRLGRYS